MWAWIMALALTLGTVSGGIGPPGTVDLWLANYAPEGIMPDGGNMGIGIGYYRLQSYWWDWDYYSLCNDTGSTVTLTPRLEWEQIMGQPQKPPMFLIFPSRITIKPWSCTGYGLSIQTGKVGAWSLWDAYLIWDGPVRIEKEAMIFTEEIAR